MKAEMTKEAVMDLLFPDGHLPPANSAYEIRSKFASWMCPDISTIKVTVKAIPVLKGNASLYYLFLSVR